MQTVGVQGLAQLRRTLGKMDKTLQTGIRDSLLESAEIVAAEARRRARVGSRPIPPGRRPMARMSETIVPFTKGAIAGIRARAVAPDGFPYPRRIEWERGGTPFMRPALEAKAKDVERSMADLLDRLADTWEAR